MSIGNQIGEPDASSAAAWRAGRCEYAPNLLVSNDSEPRSATAACGCLHRRRHRQWRSRGS